MKEAKINKVLLFPPVHSYYRFLIHKCVEDFPGLGSFSIGEGAQRQTVVCLCKSLNRGPKGQELLMSSSQLQHQAPKGHGRGKGRAGNAFSPNRPQVLPLVGKEENCSSTFSQPSSRTLGRGQGRTKKPEVQLYVPRARRDLQHDNGTTLEHDPEMRDKICMDSNACICSADVGEHCTEKKKCKTDKKLQSLPMNLQQDCSGQKHTSCEPKSSSDGQESTVNRSDSSSKKLSTVKGSRPDIQLYVPRARRKMDKVVNAETSTESDLSHNSLSSCKSAKTTDMEVDLSHLNFNSWDQSSQHRSLDIIDSARSKCSKKKDTDERLSYVDDMGGKEGYAGNNKRFSCLHKENGSHFQEKECPSKHLKCDQDPDNHCAVPEDPSHEINLISRSDTSALPAEGLEEMLQEVPVLFLEHGENFQTMQAGNKYVPDKQENSLPNYFPQEQLSGESGSTLVSDEGHSPQNNLLQHENIAEKDKIVSSAQTLASEPETACQNIISEKRQLTNFPQDKVYESKPFTAIEEVLPSEMISDCISLTEHIPGVFRGSERMKSGQEPVDSPGDSEDLQDKREKDNPNLVISSCVIVNSQSIQESDDLSTKTIRSEEFNPTTDISFGNKVKKNIVAEGDNEDDSWDNIFDDNGDCLNPSAIEELTAYVGDVKISTSKANINYLSYQAREPDMDTEAYSHVIEISDFPAEFQTRDLLTVFKDFMSRGFDIKWVDDTHALGVFASAATAREALNMVHPLMKFHPLSEASKQSRTKARRCQEFLQPYKPRPETTAAAARRLVIGALGMTPRISKEQRDQERKQLKEARERKKQDKKLKDDMWDGVVGNCAADNA